MCTSLGWTWEQARDQLDIPRIKALNRYWDANPPTHVLVRSYLQYRPNTSAPALTSVPAQTAEIVDMLINTEDGADG